MLMRRLALIMILVSAVFVTGTAADNAEALDVRIVGSTLDINDNGGEDNEIVITRTSTEVTVEDRSDRNGVTAYGGCAPRSLPPNPVAICAGTPTDIYVNLASGNNSVEYVDTLPSSTVDPPFLVRGLEGRDSARLGDGDDYVELGDGPNTANTFDGADTIIFGTGDDVAYAGPGNDSVDSGSGYDELYGEAGSDSLLGGEDTDWLYGGTEVDDIVGGAGSDIIDGGSGDDVLSGGAGNDNVDGAEGRDQVLGGAGDDDLTGGSGADRVYGGLGANTLRLQDGFADIYSCDGGTAIPSIDTDLDVNDGRDCTPAPDPGPRRIPDGPTESGPTLGTSAPQPAPAPVSIAKHCEATPSGKPSMLGGIKLKGVGLLEIELSVSKLRAGDKSAVRLGLSKNKKTSKKQARALKKLAKRIELRNAKGKIVATLIGTQWSRLAASELQPGAVNTLTVTAVPKKRGKRLLSGKPTVTVATLKPC